MSKMTWTDAVRILAVNTLYELKSDSVCRCKTELPPCWNCKAKAAMRMVAEKGILSLSTIEKAWVDTPEKATGSSEGRE